MMKLNSNQANGGRHEQSSQNESQHLLTHLQFCVLGFSWLLDQKSIEMEMDMKLIKCEITIRTTDNKNSTVYGLFRSTFDAYIATLTSVNQLCYVKVKVMS